MTNPLAQDLGGVVRLLEKASPGAWFHRESKYNGDTYIVQAPHPTNHVLARYDGDGDGYSQQEVDNAAAIAAAVNFLRAHSAEIAGALRDADRYRWLRMRLAAEELDNEDAARMALSMVGPIRFRPADSDYCGELDTAIDSAMQQGGGGGE